MSTGEIFGGAERQILTLISALNDRLSQAVQLVLFHDRELAARARQLGADVHILGARGLVDISSLLILRRFFRTHPIDVLNVNGYRALTYLALAGKKYLPPIIKTEHGRMEADTGRLLADLKTRWYWTLEDKATRRLNPSLVYVTRDLQSQYLDEHRHMAQRVIYNGIDFPDPNATTRPNEYSPDAFNLVIVGRLERVKAVDIAIRAMAEKSMPARAVLHVLGSGPDLALLTELSRELQVGSRALMHGFRSNIYDYIAHADALLMPSRHEGMPYTLLEALSLRTPVIASRVGGLAEALTHDSTGLLVHPEDPTDLAHAVQRLEASHDLGERLRTNGNRLVRERFAAESMATQYCELAQELVATKHR